MAKKAAPGEIRCFTNVSEFGPVASAGDPTVIMETEAWQHPDTRAGSINQRNSVAEKNGDENSPFVNGGA